LDDGRLRGREAERTAGWQCAQDASELIVEGDLPAETDVLAAKARDYAFDLTDRSYVTVKNLQLFACSIPTDRDSGGNGLPYSDTGETQHHWKSEPVSSSHVVIEGIEARYLNHFTDVSGHFFLQWGPSTGIVLSGSDHVIRDSFIQSAAGNGIVLAGPRNRALNNVVLDTSHQATNAAPIAFSPRFNSPDGEVGHNTIRRTSRSGISLRNFANSDPKVARARVHHNDVSNFMI
jgi:hypothetical protein